MNPSLLIISYYFPPFNRVGARRWAKHSKYLEKAGVDFSIVAGYFSGQSSWDKDIKPYAHKIKRVALTEIKYPYFQKKLPKNIFQKIRWKASYYLWQIKKNKLTGNYLDASLGNEKTFYEAAKENIQINKHNLVILSVGPFTYSKILLWLKKDFPQLKIVIDYRDEWEDAFEGLSQKQIDAENVLQRKVIDVVDLILCPNQAMKNYYLKKFTKPVYLLPHCADHEDFENLPAAKRSTGGPLTLLYGGAFYTGIEENLHLFMTFFTALNERQAARADFYVSVKGFEEILQHPKLNRQGFIGSEKYFEKVKSADYVILILPPNRVDAMSSKFFELVSLRKPILYFGGEGDVSAYLKKYRLGFHITEKTLSASLELVLQNQVNNAVPDLNYDNSKNTFEYQTALLLKELEKINETQSLIHQ